MINWFLNKNYPEYWKKYVKSFNSKPLANLRETRFVVFDTETTGLNTSTDRILSIGAVSIIGNKIKITDSLELFISSKTFHPSTVKIHGILKSGKEEKLPEEKAIPLFLKYLNHSIIIAHHAAFDIEMINQSLFRLGLPNLKNKVLDTGILYKKLNGVEHRHYGLDELCEAFKVPLHDRHNAMGDALITAQVFLKMIARMRKERSVTLGDLFIDRDRPGLL